MHINYLSPPPPAPSTPSPSLHFHFFFFSRLHVEELKTRLFYSAFWIVFSFFSLIFIKPIANKYAYMHV